MARTSNVHDTAVAGAVFAFGAAVAGVAFSALDRNALGVVLPTLERATAIQFGLYCTH